MLCHKYPNNVRCSLQHRPCSPATHYLSLPFPPPSSYLQSLYYAPLPCQSFCLWHQSMQKEWDSTGILFWRNNPIGVLFGCHVNSFLLRIINRAKLLWYDTSCSLELPGTSGFVLCALFLLRWGCLPSLVSILISWDKLRSLGPWNQGVMLLMP